MNTGGDAAEQIIRLTLNGVEVAAKIAGTAAKHIAILLYTVLNENNQNKQTCKKGKASLNSMMKSGKELTMFTVKNKDLEKFTAVAKKYGVQYCALKDRKNNDPNAQVDIITKAECAPMINRIVERYGLSGVTEKESIMPDAGQSKNEKVTGVKEQTARKPDTAKLLDDLLGKPKGQEEPMTNLPPNKARGKSHPSKNTSNTPTKSEKDTTERNVKPSVKKELQEINASRNKKPMQPVTAKQKQKSNKAR